MSVCGSTHLTCRSSQRYPLADMRLAIIALVMTAFAASSVSLIGCAHPYSDKPAKMRKPKTKARPEVEEAVADAPELDDKCKANFFADPNPRRKVSLGSNLAGEADGMLVEAEEKEGQARISLVIDALSKLTSSLKADPYGPDATYKMAVAYAMVGKKGCSLALLQRLSDLTKMPEVAGKADRIINRALRDQNFDLFRKDADAAMGR